MMELAIGILQFLTALLPFAVALYSHRQKEKQAQKPKAEILAQEKVMEKISRKTVSTVTTTEIVERVTFVE